MIAGIGTDVGKTVVSGILTTLLQADYWKPIQCGDEENSDSAVMKSWLDSAKHTVHPSAYSLKAPISPHHAAFLENKTIEWESIALPSTKRHLVVEGVGGVLVPINSHTLTLDLFKSWGCQWIVVSKHYLGSINHTLLTIEILKQLGLPLLGILFNGEKSTSEEPILEISKLPLLGRLLPEPIINPHTIQRYAKQWQPQILQCLR